VVDAYPPLAPPRRKRSRWILVLIVPILVIALCGAVSAVAVVVDRSGADEVNRGPKTSRELMIESDGSEFEMNPAGTEIAVITEKAEIHLHSVRDGKRRLALPNDESVHDIAWSTDGALLGAALRTGVVVWDTRTGVERARFHPGDSPNLITFTSDKQFAITYYTTLGLVDLTAKGPKLRTLTANIEINQWTDLIAAPDGSWVAGVDSMIETDAATLVRTRDGGLLRAIGTKSADSVVRFSPDGTVATILSGGEIRQYDVETGEQRGKTIVGAPTSEMTLAVSRDGKRAATGGSKRSTYGFDVGVQIWDLTTGSPVGEALGTYGFGAPKGTAFSADGSELLVSYVDRVRVWPAK
jgi:WD40 repeat protein